MSSRLRSFLSVGLPLIAMLALAAALPRDLGEPAFVQGWSVEARAAGLFAAILVAMITLSASWDRWSRWIEPETFGKREPRSLLDNLDTTITITAVLPFAAYHKPLAAAGWSFGWLMLVYLALTLPLLGWRLWSSWRRMGVRESESQNGHSS